MIIDKNQQTWDRNDYKSASKVVGEFYKSGWIAE